MNSNLPAKTQRRQTPLGRVFRMPLLLAASTGLGLGAALLGDAIALRALAWLGLTLPLLVLLWCFARANWR